MSATRSRRWSATTLLASGAVVALVWLAADAARADGPYEGQWREGPMSIGVEVSSWGGDCGPRPQATSSPGGGVFNISQEGDQLTFHLSRPRTTRGCWSENRAVRRVSSTHQAGTWRIVCRTPAEDSRAESGTYTIQAVGTDRLQFRDVSRYDWQLNESSCQGTITTTQTFTRVGGGTPARPEPVAEPAEPACTPGAAARMVLRPSEAELEPGGEQCFTARVVDARGCRVRARVSITLADGPGRVEGACYHAADTTGTATVRASAGSLSASARLSVHTMDLSDLIARRTESGSVGSGGPPLEDASSDTASRVSAREADDGPSLLWPSLAIVVALGLLMVAVVLLRRRGGRTGRSRRITIGGLRGVSIPDIEMPDGEATDGEAPDEAGRTRPDPVPAGAAAAHGAATPGDNKICPSCRRGYAATVARCPHDDTELMDYKEFAAGKGPGGRAPENVCPTCGERYPATVVFCGKDGTTLTPEEG